MAATEGMTDLDRAVARANDDSVFQEITHTHRQNNVFKVTSTSGVAAGQAGEGMSHGQRGEVGGGCCWR
jgi:hydrogenase maturation factor HypE